MQMLTASFRGLVRRFLPPVFALRAGTRHGWSSLVSTYRMRIKLAILILGLALILPGRLKAIARSLAGSEASQSQSQRITIKLDIPGRRGPVVFDHREHEGEINPDPAFPHKARSGVACIGCHHTVESITDMKQFRRCSECHKQEGDPAN